MNSGQEFNVGHTHLVDPGREPILVQPVKAAIDFGKVVTVCRSLRTACLSRRQDETY